VAFEGATGNNGRAPERNLCTGARPPAADTAPSWNGWGRDLDNSRYQPEPGLTAAAVPDLKMKWAF
jgi:polyvinyl alcohol dehydrogenase (cytochrome)